MRSLIEKCFCLKEAGTTIRTEIFAGLTTFTTMAYIIFVNPIILREAGMDFGAVMVATCLAAAFSTFIMAYFANYPFALAPGMGLNAYFTYTLVHGMGISWQVALGSTFLAGALFVLLNFVGLRELILTALPQGLRVALTAGIGLFLAFIGLMNIKLVGAHPETLVTLTNIKSPEVLMAALGLAITVGLMARGFKGAIIIGILSTWLLGLAVGLVQWQGLFALPPDIMPTLGQLDIRGALQPDLIGVIFAFLFITVFDAAGTITALVEQGGFRDRQGNIPRLRQAYYADAMGTVAGAALGTSMMTTYLESASGVISGGRTGLTGVVVGVLFLVALFIAPFASSIPLYATSPALIIVGALMLQPIATLHWNDPTELVPGFVVLLTIPLTFSLATGIALGLILYPVMKLLAGRGKEVHWFLWVLAVACVTKYIVAP